MSSFQGTQGNLDRRKFLQGAGFSRPFGTASGFRILLRTAS
jgi:hypothetical protein